MKISVRKDTSWKVWGERCINIHTNYCYCSLQSCKRSRGGKNYITGWNIRVGDIKIMIERRKAKRCLIPF